MQASLRAGATRVSREVVLLELTNIPIRVFMDGAPLTNRKRAEDGDE